MPPWECRKADKAQTTDLSGLATLDAQTESVAASRDRHVEAALPSLLSVAVCVSLCPHHRICDIG